MAPSYGGSSLKVEHLVVAQGGVSSNLISHPILGSSSVGSERAPDKREVGGSSPPFPTTKIFDITLDESAKFIYTIFYIIMKGGMNNVIRKCKKL